jgi:hypothetical protein
MTEAKLRSVVPTIFDFQRIPYTYQGKNPAQGLDCFTFYNYVRYKYLKEIVNGFTEYYQYELHGDIPSNFLYDISISTFGKPNGNINTTKLPFLLNDWDGVLGFSTVVEYMSKPYMLTTSTHKGSMAFPLRKYQGKIICAWDLGTSEINRIDKVDNFYGQEIC